MIIMKMMMLISNIYNRTPKSGILFPIGDFINRIDIMKNQVVLYEQKLNQSVDTSDCERGRRKRPCGAQRNSSRCIIVNNV